MLIELELYCSWSDEKTLENILSGVLNLRSPLATHLPATLKYRSLSMILCTETDEPAA